MITVVLGRRGCGKTTLIKGYVESAPRLLIFDTLAEYGSSGKVFRDITPFIDYVEARQYRQFRAVYQPVDSDLEQAFSDFMRVAWIVGDVRLVVDEIDQVSAPSSVPDELAKNLRYGRHRKISVIAASRRAAEVPRLITSQADELISFNQSEPRDIAYLESFAGRDFAERTLRLPRYKALVYRSFDGTVSERMSDSANERVISLRHVAEPREIPEPVEDDEPEDAPADDAQESEQDA